MLQRALRLKCLLKGTDMKWLIAALCGILIVVTTIQVLAPPVQENKLVSNIETGDQVAQRGTIFNERLDAILAERFPQAAPEVQAVAQAIVAGGPIPLAALDELTIEQINGGYSAALAPKWDYQHTLLREAFVSRNAQAALQLLEAGADLSVNQNELPYLAVKWQPGSDLAFPDFSATNQLLSIWLRQGGDPNAYNPAHGSLGPILNVVPENNLEGIVILLQAGADPWARIMVQSTGSGPDFQAEAFVETLSAGYSRTAEVLFRVSRMGLITAGPELVMADVMSRYERTAGMLLERSGPAGMGDQWRFVMAVGAFVQSTGAIPGPKVHTLLQRDPSQMAERAQELAGFWLAQDQLSSPDIESQKIRNDRQTGTELWDE